MTTSTLRPEVTHATLNPERQVIGGAMAHPAVLDTPLTPGHFADVTLGTLWHLMQTMREEGQPVSASTTAARVVQSPDLVRARIDPLWIAETYGAAPHSLPEAEYAARAVIDEATRRNVETAALRIGQLAQRGSGLSPDELIEAARAEVGSIETTKSNLVLLGDVIDEKLDELERPAIAMPTPWSDLNYLLKGWRPGALYVIGARPGVGKTIVGLQAALGLAQRGYVAFTSLEMPHGEITARVIAQTAEVPLGRLDGFSDDDPATALTASDWDRIAAKRSEWSTVPLVLDDRPNVTMAQIRAQARAVAQRGKLTGVIVDYLQLLSAPDGGDRRSRQEIVADYSRSLKKLAMELQVPVIVLSQLNRASESRHDKRPTMADLRESGAIEQDADIVLLLHMDDDHPTNLDMLVAKNRHGQLGTVELTRQGHYARVIARSWTPSRAV